MANQSSADQRPTEYTVTSTADRYIISIDKNSIEREFLLELMERLRIEALIHKADFNEDIVQLGEEIKAEWWQEHKEEFLKGTRHAGHR